MSLKDIQTEVIKKYNIKIEKHSTCWGRMHAHVKERKICKWVPKSSVQCTFDLFHEIGHIETTKSNMRRAESEYYATCWAIDRCKEYNIEIPDSIMTLYQAYILREIARGKRRGGAGYKEMNLYKYYGIDKSISEFKKGLSERWLNYIQ